MLAKLDDVCARHSIHYVVLWGTALGAVRHGGFIPWDDDVDVAMDRKNYEKLCAVATDEFLEPYFFQNPLTDRARFSPVARLRNSLTTAAIKDFDTVDYNNGIYIDIDVLDGRAETKFQRGWQGLLKHLLLVPIQAYNREKTPSGSLSKILAYWMNPFWHMLEFETWLRWYEEILSRYTSKNDRLCVASSFSEQNWKGWIGKDELVNSSRHPFEFLEVPLPGNVDAFLTRSYGDYNKLPAESERGAWHEGQVLFDPDVAYREFLKTRGLSYAV